MLFPLLFLVWYFVLRFSNEGSEKRALILGALAGVVFGATGVLMDQHLSAAGIVRLLLFMVAGPMITLFFQRSESILLGISVVLVGTFLFFFGIPSIL